LKWDGAGHVSVPPAVVALTAAFVLGTPERPLRLRAALASPLVAGLELVRNGALAMERHEVSEAISLQVASA
jgi:hypothetical protein